MAVRKVRKRASGGPSIQLKLFIPDSQLLEALHTLPVAGRTSVVRKAMKRAGVSMKALAAKIAGRHLALSAAAIKKSMTWRTPWSRDRNFDGPGPRTAGLQVDQTKVGMYFAVLGRPVPITADQTKFKYSYKAKWKGPKRRGRHPQSRHSGKVVTKILKSDGFKPIQGQSGGKRVFIAMHHPDSGNKFAGSGGHYYRRVYERDASSGRELFRRIPPALSVYQWLEKKFPRRQIAAHGMKMMRKTMQDSIKFYLNSRLKKGVRRANKNGTAVEIG